MTQSTSEKAKKKCSRTEKKLHRAVDTLASVIDLMALSIKNELDGDNVCDVKQIKELTGAAKELSGLMAAIDQKNGEDTSDNRITVLFEGEGEKWAL